MMTDYGLHSLFSDLGALGNYPGSPFLHSDSDILLDSPEQEDIGKNIISSCLQFMKWWRLTILIFNFQLKTSLLTLFLDHHAPIQMRINLNLRFQKQFGIGTH